MRITVDIDGAGDATSVIGPAATQAGVAAGVDEVSAAAVASRTGATNAGAAPSGPGTPFGGSSASDAASDQVSQAPWTGGVDSAGSAPVGPGSVP